MRKSRFVTYTILRIEQILTLNESLSFILKRVATLNLRLTLEINFMKKINNRNHQHATNRLVIESIRLQLTKSDEAIPRRRRFRTLPDQPSLQIFRPKKCKKQSVPIQTKAQRNQSPVNSVNEYSMPLKLIRWQSLEGEELKKIKLRIEQTKYQNIYQQSEYQNKSNTPLKIGPVVFVEDMLEGAEHVEKQQRKGMNLLKFRTLNSLNKSKQAKPKDVDGFALTPLKLSIELPRMKQKQAQILKYINRNKSRACSPIYSIQQPRMQKCKNGKMKEIFYTDYSPWTTKGQIFNPSEMPVI